MSGRKTLTLRLDQDRAEVLALIAETNGVSQNQVVLDAIDAAAERLRNDADFKDRVDRAIKRRQRVLDRLA